MAKDKYAGFYDDILTKEEREKNAVLAPATYADLVKTEPKITMDEFKETPARYFWEGISNIPESAYGLVGDLTRTAVNFEDTVKGVGELAQGTGNKMGRVAAEFMQGQELERMPERNELAADLVGEGFSDRYGSIENALNTAVNDPVGMGLDLSGVGGVIPKLGRATDLMGMAGRGTQRALGKVPERLYANSIGMRPSMRAEGAGAIDAGLGRATGKKPVPISRKGVDRADAFKKGAGAELDKIIGEAAERMVPIPRTVVTRYLDAMIADNRYVMTAPELNKLKKIKSDFDKQFGEKQTLFPEEVQAWKTAAYERAYKKEASLAPDDATSVSAKADREMARGAKESLELRMPKLKDVNNEWASYAKLREFVEKKVDTVSQSNELFGTIMNNTLRSPRFRGRLAIILDKVQRGDMGWLEKNLNTHEIRTALVLAGRYTEMLGEETMYKPLDVEQGIAP